MFLIFIIKIGGLGGRGCKHYTVNRRPFFTAVRMLNLEVLWMLMLLVDLRVDFSVKHELNKDIYVLS